MWRLVLLTIVLTARTISAAERIDVVYFDKSSAQEIGHFPAPRARQIDPNLQLDAVVQTLERSVRVGPAFTGRITVDDAESLRFRVEATSGTAVVRIAGEHDEVFERFEVNGSAWTPTVRGSTAYIEVEDGGSLRIAQLAAGVKSGESQSCLQDVACSAAAESSEVSAASRAVALLRFVRGDGSYVCTGALVDDAAKTRTPYMLTAHHCISTPEEAASIEAVWDDRSDACGIEPSMSGVKRTYGADLVATSAATDVSLLRLRRIPVNRKFLEIDLDPPQDGARLYRLSHAEGSTQKYSASVVDMRSGTCPSAPPENFIYSRPVEGAVSKGSSGAPLIAPGLRIAGQLLGICGPSANETCAIYNNVVDGSIIASWPVLAPYLDAMSVRRRAARH
jgi:hypothetical protein